MSAVKGFLAFFSAFGFIWKHRLTPWYLAPIVLYFLLAGSLVVSLSVWFRPVVENVVTGWLGTPVKSEGFWQTIRTWVTTGLQFASGWVASLLIFYLLSRVMKYVILIVLSPLLAWLSEKTEKIVTNKDYPFDAAQFIKDIIRGVAISVRNMVLELLMISLVFFIGFFLPMVAPFAGIVMFVISSYFMGFGLFDYYAERQKLSMGQSIRFMRNNRLKVTGLGIAYNLVSFIPFADWVIAPVNGAVGAVLSMDLNEKQTTDSIL